MCIRDSFTLRSGKALSAKLAEIEVVMRPVRHLPVGFTGSDPGTVVRFSLGPDRLALELSVNGGEDPFALHRATLDAELGLGAQRAYVEVLDAILDGDATLSVRGDTAEQCWRILQPIRDAWRRGDVPLEDYAAGTEGPADWPRGGGEGRREGAALDAALELPQVEREPPAHLDLCRLYTARCV